VRSAGCLQMKPEQIWQAALGELQLQMTPAMFDTWLRGSRVLAHEEGLFVVGVASGYTKDWLERRLHATIARTLTGIVGRTVEVRFSVSGNDAPPAELLVGAKVFVPAAEVEMPETPSLNPRYIFDNFVVGAHNRMAHAAARAVSESPAGAYNPLFLHGGVGLGKTHLLQAIGNASARHGLRVLYVAAEEFTNDLINAIRTHTTGAFREKYRTIDVLLLDDVQFIAGKDATQEELFHTFNTLHGQNKQLVLSSDRSPKAMMTLAERLRSRFEWGLLVDIQTPDAETRNAILRNKADALGHNVPPAVLALIAQRVQSNVRELEGALNQVLAQSALLGQPLDEALANRVLANLRPQQRTVSTTSVVAAVAAFYDLTVADLCGRDRSQQIALPRQMAMFIMREETEASLPQIGDALGGRDHTTIKYGYEKLRGLVDTDDTLRRQAAQIREALYSAK